MKIKQWWNNTRPKIIAFYNNHTFGVYVTIASILLLALASTVVPNPVVPVATPVETVSVKPASLPPAEITEPKPVSVVKKQPNKNSGHKDLIIEKKVNKDSKEPANSTKYPVEDKTLHPDYVEALKTYKLLSGQQ